MVIHRLPWGTFATLHSRIRKHKQQKKEGRTKKKEERRRRRRRSSLARLLAGLLVLLLLMLLLLLVVVVCICVCVSHRALTGIARWRNRRRLLNFRVKVGSVTFGFSMSSGLCSTDFPGEPLPTVCIYIYIGLKFLGFHKDGS